MPWEVSWHNIGQGETWHNSHEVHITQWDFNIVKATVAQKSRAEANFNSK